MQVMRKTVIYCPVVRWIGASLEGGPAFSFWEGPDFGGQVRVFGKDLLSVDRCGLLGRTYLQ